MFRLLSVNKKTKEIMIGRKSNNINSLRRIGKTLQEEYNCEIVEVVEELKEKI